MIVVPQGTFLGVGEGGVPIFYPALTRVGFRSPRVWGLLGVACGQQTKELDMGVWLGQLSGLPERPSGPGLPVALGQLAGGRVDVAGPLI